MNQLDLSFKRMPVNSTSGHRLRQERQYFVSNKIRYAEHQGSYILKFEGDIRVTLCASLDAFIKQVFSDKHLKSILLDLTLAKNIDSTALGIIAKIAELSARQLHCRPVVLSNNPDINRTLECMGLQQVLTFVDALSDVDEALLNGKSQIKDMPLRDHGQDEMCEKVLEAHKTLMALNAHNKAVFHDLVCGLEEEKKKYSRVQEKHTEH